MSDSERQHCLDELRAISSKTTASHKVCVSASSVGNHKSGLAPFRMMQELQSGGFSDPSWLETLDDLYSADDDPNLPF